MWVNVLFTGLALSASTDLFVEIYARSRAQSKDVRTIQARFVETTVSTLLLEPMVARGRVVAALPLRVRIDYTAPEKKTIFLDDKRLVVIWPDRGEREELDVSQIQERVDRYFTRASLDDLRGHFAIRALLDPALPASYRVEMTPKRKQIQKGLERLELWLDRKSLLLIQMRMVFPGGDSKVFKLEDVELNVPAPESLFTPP